MVFLEVCICTDDEAQLERSVAAAYGGGASTIELCSAMHLEGLTPSSSQISLARGAIADRSGLMVMVRPRAGDFCYSPLELSSMHSSIETIAKLGADGVVLGVLDSEQRVNRQALNSLVKTAHQSGLIVTFHRAIDAVADPISALSTLVDQGVDRVLSSGAKWGSADSAHNAIDQLIEYVWHIENQIELIIGGGITEVSAKVILDQLFDTYHSTATVIESELKLGIHTYSSVLENGVTCQDKVADIYTAIKADQYSPTLEST